MKKPNSRRTPKPETLRETALMLALPAFMPAPPHKLTALAKAAVRLASVESDAFVVRDAKGGWRLGYRAPWSPLTADQFREIDPTRPRGRRILDQWRRLDASGKTPRDKHAVERATGQKATVYRPDDWTFVLVSAMLCTETIWAARRIFATALALRLVIVGWPARVAERFVHGSQQRHSAAGDGWLDWPSPDEITRQEERFAAIFTVFSSTNRQETEEKFSRYVAAWRPASADTD